MLNFRLRMKIMNGYLWLACQMGQWTLQALLLSVLAGAVPLAPPLAAQTRNRPLTPVILISVDTLRADHMSCDGYRRIRTPSIDALTRGGTLFTEVSSQVPLTLPSHVSLFTSTYPFTNGIEENGERLAPGALTLAAILKSHGYQTAAFVGGFVLDRRFGLDQGFAFYDSPFSLHGHAGQDSGDIKRSGAKVIESATQWLAVHGTKPFFLFLHLYDLHTPYLLPVSFRPRYPSSRYDSELQYVDEILGGFFQNLQRSGLYQKSLIIFTADHGEGLGDHGEMTHGYFLYQSTLRVPLIFHWPEGPAVEHSQVETPGALLDVAPTILQFLGFAIPSQFEGKSLLREAEGKASGAGGPVHAESRYAHDHFGFGALRSVRAGRYKYIDAPKPELYNLQQDPNEMHNLYSGDRSLAVALRQRLLTREAQFRPAKPPGAGSVPADVVARLSSLGYMALAHPVDTGHGGGRDPKDGLAEYKEYGKAIDLANAGHFAESSQLLEHLLATDPALLDVRNRLGLNLQEQQRHVEAAAEFKQILKADPLNALAHFNLAVSEFALHQLDEAVRELKAALAIEPYYTRAGDLLGTIWLERNDAAQARSQFQNVLKTDPADFTALYDLGVLNGMEGHWSNAVTRLREAVRSDPRSAEAHNALGSAYLRMGDLKRAEMELTEAARLNPHFAWAHFNLGLAFQQEDHIHRAAREFRQALACDPSFTPAAQALARLKTRQGPQP